jgi:ribosome-associated protein
LSRRCPIAEPTTDVPAAATTADERRVHKTPPQLDAARQFAIDAARMAANTRCRDVAVLDVSGLSPITDFFVIATGTSPRQMRSVCDDVEEMAVPMGYPAKSRSGYEGDHWICVDFVDVIVHLFNDEARRFYDLDNLWGDARRVEWRDPNQPGVLPPPPPSSAAVKEDDGDERQGDAEQEG